MTINGKIVTLKNDKDANIFPETAASAVYLYNGNSVEDSIIRYRDSVNGVEVIRPDIVEKISTIEYNMERFDSRLGNLVQEFHEHENMAVLSQLSESEAGELLFKDNVINSSGSTVGTIKSSLDKKTISVSLGQEVVADLFFSTPNVGTGRLYIICNGKELLNRDIDMGINNIPFTVEKGTNTIEMYVVDRGGVYSNVISFRVICGALEIRTSFNTEKDYMIGTPIVFTYDIENTSDDPITTYFIINNNKYTVESEKGYNTYEFPELAPGTYKVEIYSVSGESESNRIIFTLAILASDSLFVSSLFDKSEAEEGDQIVIDYRISMQNVREFDVEYYIDDSFYKAGIGYNGTNTIPLSELSLGTRKITIKVYTKDRLHSAEVEIIINIKESSYKLIEPVKKGLIAWFDAYGLSNIDIDKHLWKDKSGNGYQAELFGLNYNTNGWIDNGLKMNGTSFARMNVQPFLENAPSGITVEVEFKTEDVGNQDARVFDCTSLTSLQLGCFVDTQKASIKSNANTVTSPFAENEKTKVTYVIDRLNKMIKLYINAVLCEVAFMTDAGVGNDQILEDVQHTEYIYLNSEKGEKNFGDCTIYGVKVYDRALDSDEILTNFIADIRDKKEQKKKFDFNYNNAMPTMYFYGDTSEMTKDQKVPLRIKYVSTNDKLYGSSFDLEDCSVNWQGTSSLQYAVKNYKIRLIGADGKKFKRSLREGMIPESTFCLKADYMDSSHANNTGVARIVNRYLYETPLPPQKDNENVVAAVDGFPIKLYINDELAGVYNFNLDKGNEDSFGFDPDLYPECVSYEVVANTDQTAGAFNKWTSSTGITELEYLRNDFELRYPDEDDVGKEYGYLDKLKRVIDWVSDADDETFRREFDEYFDREYTFRYYLLVMAFGMVDNLGKNMMLNTWDGKIWYPCFYDLDTCLSLDNSGYLKFDIDIEVQAGTFNTSGSKLWSKLARVFDAELKQTYKDMRTNTFKEENIFKILIEEQIDKIPESLYNLDSEKKYIKYGRSYIHMLHGNRKQHMKRWINERLLYLDSKLGYEKNTRESITIRANKAGLVYFDIKTYSPMFVKVVWRNGAEQVQKVGRDQTVRFSYNLPTATDQEIFIYGAKHLKEIGDISHMTPTSMSLANATKLTKLVCTNNTKLQALGMGGEFDGVNYGLKNLQLLDLTGCSNLGKTSGNSGLDLSYCANLKVLKVKGTALQNVTFDARGGNLEEVYMANSVTSLQLINQYSLTKLEFETFSGSDYLHKNGYTMGSKITNLTITNCPKLTEIGLNQNINFNNSRNYRETIINNQREDFDISKEDYKQAFKTSCFTRLETLNITNALHNIKYFTITLSPNLKTVRLNNIENIKGLIFTGNRYYGDAFSIESAPMFENIYVDDCNNFDTIILQPVHHTYSAYKFKENFTLDLSHLPLKRFICAMALENLKKIILPNTIKEFSHSRTYLSTNTTVTADGSRYLYTKEFSPLDTIVVDGHYEDDFVGIDLANIPLKNVSLRGLTQPVNIIKNIISTSTEVNPSIVSEHITPNIDNTNNPEQKIENISIDFSDYISSDFASMFGGADLSQINITCNKPINVSNPDYSYMFVHAKNITWENTGRLLSNLPAGKVYRTFERITADKLVVGNMIGATTTDLRYCFRYSDIGYIDLTGADTSNVIYSSDIFAHNQTLLYADLSGLDLNKSTNTQGLFYNCPTVEYINLTGVGFASSTTFSGMFESCTNLKTLLGMENSVSDKCTNLGNMFKNCKSIERINIGGDWSNVTNLNTMFFTCSSLMEMDLSELNLGNVTDMGYMFRYCTNIKSIKLSKTITNVTNMTYMFGDCNSLTHIDLSGYDLRKLTSFTYVFQDCTSAESIDLSNTDFSSSTNLQNLFARCTNVKSINLSNCNFSKVTNMGSIFSGCTLLDTIDMSNCNFDSIQNISYIFSSLPSLREVNLTNCSVLNVNNMQALFENCPKLENVIAINRFINEKCTNIFSMFRNCKALQNIDLSGSTMTAVTTMQEMFRNCTNLINVNLSNCTMPAVTTMLYMFENCPNLQYVNMSNCNTMRLTNMNYMFQNCKELLEVDMTGFNTDNVTSMLYLFNNCHKLEKILGVEELIKEKCTQLLSIFYNCYKLRFDNVEKLRWKFSESGLDNIYTSFYGCGKDIELLPDEENILDMSECNHMYLNATNSYRVFENTGFTKIRMKLKFSNQQYKFDYQFTNSKNLKELDLSDSILNRDIRGIAAACPNLTKVIMRNTDMSGVQVGLAGSIFNTSKNLTDLEFGTGLKYSVDFSTNVNLTQESLMSVINNLGTAESGQRLTLGATNLAKLTPEQIKIATDKNWSVA